MEETVGVVEGDVLIRSQMALQEPLPAEELDVLQLDVPQPKIALYSHCILVSILFAESTISVR